MGQRPVATSVAFTLLALSLGSPGTCGEVTEVGGHIRTDTVWRGRVVVVEDVIITNAVVQVEPGSWVELRAVDARPSRIIIEGRRGRPAELQLNGTAREPIRIQTTEGGSPGAILIPTAATFSPDEEFGRSIPHGALRATHTHFEHLGGASRGDGRTAEQRPAIHMQLTNPGDVLELRNCTFLSCGPVMANFVHDECTAIIEGTRFEQPLDDAAVEFYGSGRGQKRLMANRSSAGLRMRIGPGLIRGNFLIGDQAWLDVSAPEEDLVTIRENYVHNTNPNDMGTYCLRCDSPQAVIENNVMRGGTWVVQRGSRTVTGNWLVGTSGLRAPKREAETTTHRLVADIPAGATLAENVLMGPAYSMVSTSRSCRDVLIRGNLFLGGGVSNRGVHLNALADEPVAARIEENDFVGLTGTAIYGEAHHPEAVASCRGNRFADMAGRRYDIAGSFCDAESADQQAAPVVDLKVNEVDWADVEQGLLAGETTVLEVLAKFEARLLTRTGRETSKP